jgi:signal transduction histidine kinase
LPRGYILNLIPRLAEEATAAALDHTRKGPLDFFMLALDKSGRIVFCDDHFPQLFQLKKADILGYNISEFLYSYFLHYLAKQEKDFLTFASGCGDRPVTLDFLSGRDRERRPILCEFMLRDASFPASWEMLLIGMDMKQRLELNRLIEFERESLHQLRYGQFDMVITIDKDFRIKTINNACLDKLKAKQRDLADTDFADLLARACDRRSFAQGVAQAQTLKDVFNLRLDLAFREQVIPSLANISAVRDSFNDEIGYVIVLRDIERQLKMEATLRHVERMQALGQLAAGTAHQINNYTNAVLGSTDLLADFVESAKSVLPVPASEAEEVLNIIRESVQKLTSLTHHLTAFARAQQAPVISAGDVNSVVTGTLELTNTLVAKKAISLDIDLAENLPAVYFSPLHLEQAVLNILMNAVDAVGDEGGRLAVSTFREQNHVCIRIADNGPGIPTEVRGRLFEAFVTTKPEGVGTGLGLNVARDVVDSIKGEIKVDSEPGKGTTMTIRIPVPAKGETANA